jgi:hypothetical protein
MPKGRKVTMNTLTTIIDSIDQAINESVIDDLSKLGYSHTEAVKVVVETDFDITASAEEFPVEAF